jgi:transcription initiation factor TFIID subunit 13
MDKDDDDEVEREETKIPFQRVTASNNRKIDFSKDIRCQLYGFGDDPNPYTETINLVEDLVIQFIADTTSKALAVGKPGKISLEDVTYVIRKDKRKAVRARQLIYLDDEIKKARKGIDAAACEYS